MKVNDCTILRYDNWHQCMLITDSEADSAQQIGIPGMALTKQKIVLINRRFASRYTFGAVILHEVGHCILNHLRSDPDADQHEQIANEWALQTALQRKNPRRDHNIDILNALCKAMGRNLRYPYHSKITMNWRLFNEAVREVRMS